MSVKKKSANKHRLSNRSVTAFSALAGLEIDNSPNGLPPQANPKLLKPTFTELLADDESRLFLEAVAGVKKMKSVSASCSRPQKVLDKTVNEPEASTPEETNLFLQAMAGVKGLNKLPQSHKPKIKSKNKSSAPIVSLKQAEPILSEEDHASIELFIREMELLNPDIKPSDISDTFSEEEDFPVSGNRMKLVKSGIIPVLHQLDLHGLTCEEMLAELPAFIERARNKGQQAVLVITGKGLHSPLQPVLRPEVLAWLENAGKKMVLEFGTAPREMGGSGALVIFLRPVEAVTSG